MICFEGGTYFGWPSQKEAFTAHCLRFSAHTFNASVALEWHYFKLLCQLHLNKLKPPILSTSVVLSTNVFYVSHNSEIQNKLVSRQKKQISAFYYMASSVSGQEEPNRAL